MSQLLHVEGCATKETEDGNVSTITLGAVSANAGELIPLVGEEVILSTPGQKGRTFHGSMSALLVKDGKHGPEVTVKVVGDTILNGLVGTNVEIEAAQMELPRFQGLNHTPGHVLCPACAPGASAVLTTVNIRPLTPEEKAVVGAAKAEVEKIRDDVYQQSAATPLLKEMRESNADANIEPTPKQVTESLAKDDLENF